MGYEISLKLGWDELDKIHKPPKYIVFFLGDEYLVRFDNREVLVMPSLIPAREMESVLILHYLIYILNHDFRPSGQWVSFKETEGGKVFWPAFQESAIKPLIECFRDEPDKMAENLTEQLGGKIVKGGDLAVEMATFPEILVRIIFWRGDGDLPPEATMLFDRTLLEMYCTEDVAVLLMMLVQRIGETPYQKTAWKHPRELMPS